MLYQRHSDNFSLNQSSIRPASAPDEGASDLHKPEASGTSASPSWFWEAFPESLLQSSESDGFRALSAPWSRSIRRDNRSGGDRAFDLPCGPSSGSFRH